MSWFFFIVFAVYGGIHATVFLRARTAFGFGTAPGGALAVFMLFMVFAPFVIRALEQRDYETTARYLSFFAYLWMALLFLFFTASLAFDAMNLVARVAGTPRPVPVRIAFLLCLGLALTACVYGYAEARRIRADHVRVETDKLPPGMDRFTIVQISDVHLGLIVRCARLDRILAVVKAANPDLLVSTGDLVDAQINHLPGMVKRLRAVNAPYGKLAVTGNHEYYAGLKHALAFTEKAGFRMLRNESLDIGPIRVAGVDDRAGARASMGSTVPDRAALAGLDRTKFLLFLKHQPTPDPDARGLFDLMLSGHTHKGQIWPFTLLVRASYPLLAGTYDLGKGSLLHTSRGSGTWGPPIRLFAPPEVTVITLVRKTL